MNANVINYEVELSKLDVKKERNSASLNPKLLSKTMRERVRSKTQV